jgi:hypothetical protein
MIGCPTLSDQCPYSTKDYLDDVLEIYSPVEVVEL